MEFSKKGSQASKIKGRGKKRINKKTAEWHPPSKFAGLSGGGGGSENTGRGRRENRGNTQKKPERHFGRVNAFIHLAR